jgi:hypothetical protein
MRRVKEVGPRRHEMGEAKTTSHWGLRRRLQSSQSAFVLVSVLIGLLIVPATAVALRIEAFSATARNADGTIDELAGTHPYSLEVHASVVPGQTGEPEDPLQEIQVTLPPGLVGTVLNVPRCSAASLASCGGSEQAGVLRGILAGLGEVVAPIYNLAPEFGDAGGFGVVVNEKSLVQRFRLVGTGADSAVRLRGSVPPTLGLTDIDEEIWGVPADPAHDPERICRSTEGDSIEGCASGAEQLPLLTLPTTCSSALLSTLAATSVGPPPVTAVASAVSRDAGGNPRPLSGCERVPFDPRLTVQSEGVALAPSPLTIGAEVPQYKGTETTVAASLAELRVELPEGLALNPSAGASLSSCSPAAIGLESAAGAEPPAFDEGSAECPLTSRLGTVKVRAPLFDHELDGSIYLATPTANPFAAKYAIYLVIEDKASGTILKVPGRLDADPRDGQLTATIPELPLFPFDDLELEFAGGPQAPLASPSSCGRYATEATFTPSTVPFGFPAARSAGFTLSSGAGGKPCPPPEAERNAAPSFQVGTERAVAGTDSSLVMRLSREDTDQHLSFFDLTLPPGLLANLGSVPLGAPIGSVQAKVGIGPEPLPVDGTVYLEGPYHGAPYSLEAVVPAKVGPFDLGTIVERAAINVDPGTAQIKVAADPLPQILAGVPLQLRGLSLDLDRPGFIRNPTSCEPMSIKGSATTSLGEVAPLSERFQVGECATLPFKPKLSLRFAGALGRNGHPALRAVLRNDPESAAPASAAFSLPAGELLDLRHLRGLCPRGVAAERCPKSSRLGSLRIDTPALGEPLEGPVYLRVPSHRLPDLSVELRSGQIGFVLQGRTTDARGRFGVSFGSIPDIPLSEAVLSFSGGRAGIVVNSRSLCSAPGRATASLSAHSGKRVRLDVRARPARHC